MDKRWEIFLTRLRCPVCGKELRVAEKGVSCKGCSQIVPFREGILDFCSDTPPTKLERIYDAKAKRHGASWRAIDYFTEGSFRRYQKHLFDFIGPLKNKIVLDVGCGNGALTEPLVKDNLVVSVDLSLKQGVLAAQRGFLACRAQAEDLPFFNETFDVVLHLDVIQGFSSFHSTVSDMKRLLRGGGLGVLGTLNGASFAHRILRFLDPSHRKRVTLHRTSDIFYSMKSEGFGELTVFYDNHPFWGGTVKKAPFIFSEKTATVSAVKGRKT